MTTSSEKNQADVWSKRALERIAHDGVTPSPRNYSVYYHYFAGDVPGLINAYDAIAASGKVTQQHCSELYDKHISVENDIAFFKDASSIIDAELRKVMEMITSSAQGTNQFGENLNSFSGKLSGASSIDMLRDAVAKIVDETRNIAAQNQKLQGELQATTQQLTEIRTDFDRVHKESHIDALTEVGNRKYFDREILHKMNEARDQNSVLSLLMVDIDHFKNFNDTHGHLIGDQVLRLVARTLVENLKGRDVIARFGGEEFVILLPQTKLQDAERVANQLRASLATKNIRKRGSKEILGVVTVSLGAAEYVAGEESDTLIARADTALYKAKQTGRNKVVCLEAEKN